MFRYKLRVEGLLRLLGSKHVSLIGFASLDFSDVNRIPVCKVCAYSSE